MLRNLDLSIISLLNSLEMNLECFLYLHCFGSACSDSTEGLYITLSSFWKFCGFLLSFFSISNNNFLFLFLKLVISLVIPEVLLHFRSCNPAIVGLLLTKWLQTYWNDVLQSLISNDLGQCAKYVHCLPISSTSLSPFTLQVRVIHKINQILLISLQMLVTSFFTNIIDASCNLNRYMHYKLVLYVF